MNLILPKGDKGDAFVYNDFTPEQLASLTGPQGEVGPKGDRGEKGDKGDAFQYSDFTQEQLELLRGPQGDKGDKGNVGEQGPQGPKGDKGETYDDTEIKNNVELLESQIPNGQAVGEYITLTDSSNLPYEKFNICGKSIQDGTPTPEAPVEIKSVGDDGTAGIKQSGKNLFDKNNFDKLNAQPYGGTIIAKNSEMILYFKCEKNTIYSFQKLLGTNYPRMSVAETTEAPNVNVAYQNIVNLRGTSNNAYTTSDTAEYIVFWYYCTGSELTEQEILDSIQIEKEETPTEYEPYKEDNYTLQLSEPLRSLPNGVRDTIEEDGIHRRVGSVVIDGVNKKVISVSVKDKSVTANYKSSLIKQVENQDVKSVFSRELMSSSIRNTWNAIDLYAISQANGGQYLQISLPLEIGTTADEINAWLQQHPITAQYELAEEIIEPYEDNPLQKATTYKNITHIFSTDEVSPVFDITYKKDLEILHSKNYLTNEELEDKGYLTEVPDTYKTKTENDELYQSKGNYANKDDIPTKTSELENDSGFLEHKGTFYDWPEFDAYEFKEGEMFLFTLSGALSSYSGDYIGKYSGFYVGTGYIYRYINCCNLNTLQTLRLDILNKKIYINQMNIQDTNDYFTSTGLDDILQEIGGQLNGVEELLGGI